MHTLSRQIRFSIDPFSADQSWGYNSYASKPGVEGLGFYFALWVDLESRLNPDTGFVVNVSEIDKVVRQKAFPVFKRAISIAMDNKHSLQLIELVEILKLCFKEIDESFDRQRLVQLQLELNPYRTISIQAEDAEMFTFSEKFEFSAMHQLWNERFDEEKNFELFGKCANVAGHGHNYVLEVSISLSTASARSGGIYEFEKVVEKEFLGLVDHKNLNLDVPGFENLNPTVENLAYYAWEKLEGKFENGQLAKITIWENDRTFCSYTR